MVGHSLLFQILIQYKNCRPSGIRNWIVVTIRQKRKWLRPFPRLSRGKNKTSNLLIGITNEDFGRFLLGKNVKHGRVHVLSFVDQENVMGPNTLKIWTAKLVKFWMVSQSVLLYEFWFCSILILFIFDWALVICFWRDTWITCHWSLVTHTNIFKRPDYVIRIHFLLDWKIHKIKPNIKRPVTVIHRYLSMVYWLMVKIEKAFLFRDLNKSAIKYYFL